MPFFSYIILTIYEGGPFLKTYIEERAVEVANFIINSNATVRETAKKFGISKSTVHTVLLIRVGQKLRLIGR